MQIEAIQRNPELKLHPPAREIDSKYNRTAPVDHEALDLKAIPVLLLNYDTVEEYFAAHRTLRSQMNAAVYSSISHERTSIKFIIRRLANHPHLEYVLTTWASQPPNTIQDLKSIVLSAQSMAQHITSHQPLIMVTLTPHPPASNSYHVCIIHLHKDYTPIADPTTYLYVSSM